jgi:hypothetical protein
MIRRAGAPGQVWAEVPQICCFRSRDNSFLVDRRGMVISMTLRAVTCAWCSAEMMVPDPVRGRDGYFVLPRRCRQCAGNNVVEIDGALSIVRQQRRQRRRTNTQKITAIKPLAV